MLAKISVILNVLHAWCLQQHLVLGLHLAQLLKPCGYLMWTRCSWGCLPDILDLVSILARYSSRVAKLSALSDSILSLILLFTLFMLMLIWVRKGVVGTSLDILNLLKYCCYCFKAYLYHLILCVCAMSYFNHLHLCKLVQPENLVVFVEDGLKRISHCDCSLYC